MVCCRHFELYTGTVSIHYDSLRLLVPCPAMDGLRQKVSVGFLLDWGMKGEQR